LPQPGGGAVVPELEASALVVDSTPEVELEVEGSAPVVGSTAPVLLPSPVALEVVDEVTAVVDSTPVSTLVSAVVVPGVMVVTGTVVKPLLLLLSLPPSAQPAWNDSATKQVLHPIHRPCEVMQR
jgi:hypothetical protein